MYGPYEDIQLVRQGKMTKEDYAIKHDSFFKPNFFTHNFWDVTEKVDGDELLELLYDLSAISCSGMQ